MLTLELVDSASKHFGFDIEETTENIFIVRGSLFNLSVKNNDSRIKLNLEHAEDVADEELMEELAEIRCVRDALYKLL